MSLFLRLIWILCIPIGLSIFPDSANAQTLTPRVLPSAGGYVTAGGASLSYTIGEPVTATFQNGNLILTQGQQQPYITLIVLNLRAFIEGLYLGGGQMQASLYNNFPSTFAIDDCDTVIIELHDPLSPFGMVASDTAIIKTSGHATVRFPAALSGESWYIVLKHRNSVETWSKTPVLMNGVTIFDFTDY